jgi:DNA modification methylase
MEDILSTFTPIRSRILVPCLGSGNTLLAASNLGMYGMGTDTTQAFRDRYALRVNASEPGKYTSYSIESF